MAAYRVRDCDGKPRATTRELVPTRQVAGFTAKRPCTCFRVEQALLQRAWSARVS